MNTSDAATIAKSAGTHLRASDGVNFGPKASEPGLQAAYVLDRPLRCDPNRLHASP